MEQDNKWSAEAWKASLPIYEAILELPFIKELAEGTLDREIFNRYIRQDSLYIKEYSRVLAHIASRLEDVKEMEAFIGFAGDGVLVEKELHGMYVSDEAVEMSPTCLFYTSFLKAQSMEPVEVEAAAVLPCFWIYLAVGKHILSIAKLEGNPYADWIRTYSDAGFETSTEKAIAICDRLAAGVTNGVRERMTNVYVKAARMEWMFWDAACQNYNWKI